MVEDFTVDWPLQMNVIIAVIIIIKTDVLKTDVLTCTQNVLKLVQPVTDW